MQFIDSMESLNFKSLVKHLEEMELKKRDFVFSFADVSYFPNVFTSEYGKHELSLISEDQLCKKLGIPHTYFKRMKALNVPLLNESVNSWKSHFSAHNPKKNILLRCYEKKDKIFTVRALLSDRYKIIEHLPLLEHCRISAKLKSNEIGEVKSLNCNLSDTEMSITYSAYNVRVDDLQIHCGITVRNSETGHGTLSVTPKVFIDDSGIGISLKEVSLSNKHLGPQLPKGLQGGGFQLKTDLRNQRKEIKNYFDTYLSPSFISKQIQKWNSVLSTYISDGESYAKRACKKISLSSEAEETVLSHFRENNQGQILDVLKSIIFVSQTLSVEERKKIQTNLKTAIR